MTAWKFVHAADLHLDSPLRGLERYEGAPVDEMRGATREAFKSLVDLCVEEHAQFLILAGDIYDGDWKDFQSGLFFNHQMRKLGAAGIQVYTIRGNHDAQSAITKELRLPDNVFEFPSDKAVTASLPQLSVSLHGRSYGFKEMTDNLAVTYPDAVPGHLNIGILHTALTGREPHAPYAPCTEDDLVGKGYDYWALGHVHERQIVRERPTIAWSGVLQGRHARETGAKGCLIVEVEEREILRLRFRALDVVRWHVVDVDIAVAATAAEVVQEVCVALERVQDTLDGRMLAARVRLTGVGPAHGDLVSHQEQWKNEIRSAVGDLSSEVWVEKVVFATRSPVDVAALSSRNDAVGGLLRSIDEIRKDDSALLELADAIDDIRSKLPRSASEPGGELDFESTENMRRILDVVEQKLLPKLSLIPADDGQ